MFHHYWTCSSRIFMVVLPQRKRKTIKITFKWNFGIDSYYYQNPYVCKKHLFVMTDVNTIEIIEINFFTSNKK